MLTVEQHAELASVASSRFVDAAVGTRARLVLWWDAGYPAAQIAELAGVSEPTARSWPRRYAEGGLAALDGVAHPGKPKQHPGRVRARILSISQCTPPRSLGVSHWSSRLLSEHLARAEGIRVSHVYVADLWREVGLQPWRQGTFTLSADPRFADKVADVVGLYLDPPAGALVLYRHGQVQQHPTRVVAGPLPPPPGQPR